MKIYERCFLFGQKEINSLMDGLKKYSTFMFQNFKKKLFRSYFHISPLHRIQNLYLNSYLSLLTTIIMKQNESRQLRKWKINMEKVNAAMKGQYFWTFLCLWLIWFLLKQWRITFLKLFLSLMGKRSTFLNRCFLILFQKWSPMH